MSDTTRLIDTDTWLQHGDVDVAPGTPARPSAAAPFHQILADSLSRRAFLKYAGAIGATLVLSPVGVLRPGNALAGTAATPWPQGGSRLRFQPVPPGNNADVAVPPNYSVDVILRWGDPLFSDAPEFSVAAQTAAAQARQFGFNADLVLWYPLPEDVRGAVQHAGRLDATVSQALGAAYPALKDRYSRHALVVVNHEYTTAADMFPDFDPATYPTQEQARVEIEAHGFSVVELRLGEDGRWRFDRRSPFNRRCTGSTPIEVAGPLRGHPMMRTSADPDGTRVLGSLNNCAGGRTPWGTILTCEENFDQYFANFERVQDESVKKLSMRIPAEKGATERGWEKHVERFDLARHPTEYNRFGWVVEVDPYDPVAPARKRTALGRFKHEGAVAAIARDGRVAVYSGDDARFEYVYKFVTAGRFDPADRKTNMGLLDSGSLYVARFEAGGDPAKEMGTGVWLELSPNNPVLAGWTLEEILLNTRGAADLVGATPMDRPEDVEVSAKTGRVYIALTNNSRRTEPNAANPRVKNEHGHIIELVESGDDAASLAFGWNILVKCGDPKVTAHDTRFGDVADPVAAGVSPISDPDNLVLDDDGNLWIATDGQYYSGKAGFGQNDGIFAVPVDGPDRGLLRQFLSGVPGGEVCGPEFSGDNTTFFCAIQHPHESQKPEERNAFRNVWPIGDKDGVSKPALIAVREKQGRKIGS